MRSSSSRSSSPRSRQPAGRLEPGAGHYDWPETLDALEAIGYRGWLAMECGLSGPVDQVLPKVAEVLSR
jgi:sugar phosphate isomerase/epimerase